MLVKSEYSYLQYHWCPTVLIVSDGEFTSSVKYRRCRDGTAKNTSVIAGRMVHTVSICWASIRDRDENLFIMSIINVYVTTDVTNTRITSEWSWNEIIWSIMGVAASWKRSCPQCGI